MRLLTALLLLLPGLLTACGPAPLSTTGDVRAITVEDAATLLQEEPDRVVLDLRTPEEYAEGHLEGARLVNFYDEDFEEQVAALDRDQPYLIHCATGGRSGSASGLMRELGFTDVVDMAAGFRGWSAAGLPVVTETT